jgi:hypothetical protein
LVSLFVIVFLGVKQFGYVFSSLPLEPELLKAKRLGEIYTDSVRTSQKTHVVSLRKRSHLILFGEINAVF